MKILLTGASGFIGKYVAEELRGRKHTIVEFSRARGFDITRYENVERAAKGCDIIIHAAAEVDETQPLDYLRKINVGGTKNALKAAESVRAKQFIHISSVSVFGSGAGKKDEKSALQPLTNYERTKKEAEDVVLSYQEEFPITIIRPALVLGPNKYWKDIFTIIRKGFPLIGKGENAWQMIHARDLAIFIAQCAGNEDTYNETYICAEMETHTLREIVDMIADIQGVKRVGSIPPLLGYAASYVFALQGMITGKKSILIPAHVARLFKHREYSIQKALATGWKPLYSTRAALEETYRVLRESGMLSEKRKK